MASKNTTGDVGRDPVAMTYAHMDRKNMEYLDSKRIRTRQHFNPSSLSSCPRALFYQAVGAQHDVVKDGGWLTQYGPYGDFAHDQVRTVMRGAGVLLDGLKFNLDGSVEELDIVDNQWEYDGVSIGLRGRGDGRIWLDSPVGPSGEALPSGWYYLEVKSVGAGKYRWMQNAYQEDRLYKYIEDKYPNYIDQPTAMASPEGLNLLGTYLLIVNRDNCQFGFSDKSYTHRAGGLVFPFDPERWERLQKKMAFINRCAKDGEAPVQPFDQSSRQCSMCSYPGVCWDVAD